MEYTDVYVIIQEQEIKVTKRYVCFYIEINQEFQSGKRDKLNESFRNL